MLYDDRAVASSAISQVYRLEIIDIFYDEMLGSLTTDYRWQRAIDFLTV